MTKSASDGENYIGLVTRGSLGPYANVNEDIETVLTEPLPINETYNIKIDLSFSENWGHFIDFGTTFLKYDTPAKLRIFGGENPCEKAGLLWESPVIDHTDWQTYTATLKPQQTEVNFLIFQAEYTTETTKFGNILIDNIQECLSPPIETVPFDSVKCANAEVKLDASTADGSYLWNTGATTSSILVDEAGVYTVQISNDCETGTYTFSIEGVDCGCETSAPNVFTPNGDGINEKFEVTGAFGLTKYKLRVFNRAGLEVFESEEINDFWDGTSNGNELPSGIYYFVIDITCTVGTSTLNNSNKGWVTIMR